MRGVIMGLFDSCCPTGKGKNKNNENEETQYLLKDNREKNKKITDGNNTNKENTPESGSSLNTINQENKKESNLKNIELENSNYEEKKKKNLTEDPTKSYLNNSNENNKFELKDNISNKKDDKERITNEKKTSETKQTNQENEKEKEEQQLINVNLNEKNLQQLSEKKIELKSNDEETDEEGNDEDFENAKIEFLKINNVAFNLRLNWQLGTGEEFSLLPKNFTDKEVPYFKLCFAPIGDKLHLVYRNVDGTVCKHKLPEPSKSISSKEDNKLDNPRKRNKNIIETLKENSKDKKFSGSETALLSLFIARALKPEDYYFLTLTLEVILPKDGYSDLNSNLEILRKIGGKNLLAILFEIQNVWSRIKDNRNRRGNKLSDDTEIKKIKKIKALSVVGYRNTNSGKSKLNKENEGGNLEQTTSFIFSLQQILAKDIPLMNFLLNLNDFYAYSPSFDKKKFENSFNEKKENIKDNKNIQVKEINFEVPSLNTTYSKSEKSASDKKIAFYIDPDAPYHKFSIGTFGKQPLKLKDFSCMVNLFFTGGNEVNIALHKENNSTRCVAVSKDTDVNQLATKGILNDSTIILKEGEEKAEISTYFIDEQQEIIEETLECGEELSKPIEFPQEIGRYNNVENPEVVKNLMVASGYVPEPEKYTVICSGALPDKLEGGKYIICTKKNDEKNIISGVKYFFNGKEYFFPKGDFEWTEEICSNLTSNSQWAISIPDAQQKAIYDKIIAPQKNIFSAARTVFEAAQLLNDHQVKWSFKESEGFTVHEAELFNKYFQECFSSLNKEIKLSKNTGKSLIPTPPSINIANTNNKSAKRFSTIPKKKIDSLVNKDEKITLKKINGNALNTEEKQELYKRNSFAMFGEELNNKLKEHIATEGGGSVTPRTVLGNSKLGGKISFLDPKTQLLPVSKEENKKIMENSKKIEKESAITFTDKLKMFKQTSFDGGNNNSSSYKKPIQQPQPKTLITTTNPNLLVNNMNNLNNNNVPNQQPSQVY